MQLKSAAAGLAALLVIGCGGQATDNVGSSRAALTTAPTKVYSNVVMHCADVAADLGLAGTFVETLIDPDVTPNPTTLALGGTFTASWVAQYSAFDWTATGTTIPLVIGYYWVPSGPPGDSAAYVYQPAATSGGTLETPNGANFDLVKVCQLVPEENGCTLTQGYWKTHADASEKQFDATWNMLASGPDTTFFLSGQTWIEVFNTAPAGNAYYQLAHQYMAARLNVIAGASDASIATSLASAEAFFAAYTPTTTLSKAKRAEIIALAGVLGSYNEGTTGPGHCE